MRNAGSRPTMPPRQGGFTLLELIVAIAVFSAMAAAGYGGLGNVLDAHAVLDARRVEFGNLVTAVNLLQQDVENVVARSVRDAFGDDVPAIRSGAGGALLELTRYTAAGVFRESGVDLRRVEYRLEAGQLFRVSWEELDRHQGSIPQRRLLLTDIAAIDFRFFSDAWTAYWPLRNDAASLNTLPKGMELMLRFRDGKTLRRTFLVER